MDWRGAYIVLLYKGRSGKYVCGNSRGIRRFSVVVYLHCRVVFKRGSNWTECVIEKEQCDFRSGGGFMDKLLSVWQVCKKYYVANGKMYFFVCWVGKDLWYDSPRGQSMYCTSDLHIQRKCVDRWINLMGSAREGSWVNVGKGKVMRYWVVLSNLQCPQRSDRTNKDTPSGHSSMLIKHSFLK